jgi:hypothetical protein
MTDRFHFPFRAFPASERWRETYDAWKLATPEDDARVCDECGGWLARSIGPGWHCERCDDLDVDRLREDREERRRMEKEP